MLRVPIILSNFIRKYFWKRVNKLSDDECWNWIGTSGAHGYGVCNIYPKCRAHRLSWAIHNSDPLDMQVLHKCDNVKCVNPRHLFLGSQKDNVVDCRKKNRNNNTCASGERNMHSVLNSLEVNAVKYFYSLGSVTQSQLAKIFNVNQSNISRILTNKQWRTQ